MKAGYDACPKCGGAKRKKNRQCAGCYGYGTKRHIAPSGYVRVWRPGHPLAKRDGYVLEHRLVVHEAGVAVPPGFHVHHRNGDKTDNRFENLEVIAAGEHSRYHRQTAGFVQNQFGVWKVAQTEAERLTRRREVCRLHQRRLRAKRSAA